jgi:peptidyl-prolyl cis-trans isomerase SurA
MKTKIIALLLLAAPFLTATAQQQVIDEVVAVVGSKTILKSDIENQYAQFLATGNIPDESVKCRILEQMMISKLLLHQAILDSVEVSDEQVDSELDRKINYFIGQIGSQEKLEEYFKKSLVEIKAEYRELLREQLLTQTMQGKVTGSIAVTPSDVRNYYDRIPPDSLPYLNTDMQIAQITRKPPENKEEIKAVRERLEEIRQRILKGEEFSTMAVLYSIDPSSKKGGELGFVNRGDLVPEFESVAFSLKPNEVSGIVQTQFGYHIIQLIERRGNQINVRHILMKPRLREEDMAKAKAALDSVAEAVRKGTISFADAAAKYSDDEETKNNGGTMVNMQTGSSRFEADQLDPTLAFTLSKMKVGEISEPVIFQTPDGKQGYRLVLLKDRVDAHKANLKDDYQKIQSVALAEKQNNALKDWVSKKRSITFIHVGEGYRTCSETKDWLKKQ